VRLFRRRTGRHAAPRPEPDAAVPPAAPGAPAAPPAQREPRIPPPPTGAVQPYGQVRLGFGDGSAVTLSADDPRVRAFRALARELASRDPRS
jgi:hypothetical protein